MIGETIGHYKILEKLGEGGMGQVYRAQDQNLDRQVAIKMLPPTLATDPNRLRRLKREAQVLATLDHPNIVSVYAVDKIDEVPFLAMELVEGKNLSDFITKEGLSLHDFFEVAIPLTEALSVAHERGIIHRDLKPSNIMVSKEGDVKVLDFGLAKVRQLPGDDVDPNASTEALTVEGHVLGTMPYMAPEQVQGMPVDQRSDIFSLGIVLYQMATGHRPFKGANSAELISSILRDEPDPIDDLKQEMPHHLGRIVRQCLEKEPEKRLESAKDVHIQLSDLRREVTTDRRRSASDTGGALEEPTPPAYKSRLPRWVTALIGVAAVAVAVFIAIWLLGIETGGYEPLGPEAQALVQQAELFEQRGSTRQNQAAAEERYRRALTLEAGHPFVQSKLAALLARKQRQYPLMGQAEEATDLAEGALEQYPGLPEAHVALGTLALLDGDAEGAAAAAREAQSVDEEVYSGHSLLGEALVAQDRVDEGLVELRLGAELAGADLRGRATLARVLKDLGRYSEAAAEYEGILDYNPDQPTALNNLAVIYMRSGRNLDAIPLLNRALRLEEDEAAASNLGAIYFELGQMDKAIEAYQRAYGIAPDKPYAPYNIGETYEVLGDLELAQEWYETAMINFDKALEAGGPRSLFLALRALCAVKLDRSEEALAGVEEALELDPSNTNRIFNAAQVAALAEESELLFDYITRAIELGHPRQDFYTDSAFKAYQKNPEFLRLLGSDLDS